MKILEGLKMVSNRPSDFGIWSGKILQYAWSNEPYLKYALLHLYYPLSPMKGHINCIAQLYVLWCMMEIKI